MLKRDCIIYILNYLPYTKRIECRLLSKKYSVLIKINKIYINERLDYSNLALVNNLLCNATKVNCKFIEFLSVLKLGTNIEHLTISVGNYDIDLNNLWHIHQTNDILLKFNLKKFKFDCSILQHLVNLKKLKVLSGRCSKGINLNALGNLKNLTELDYKFLSEDINCLQNLTFLKTGRFVKLEHFNKIPLQNIYIYGNHSVFDFNNMPTLLNVYTYKCPNIKENSVAQIKNCKLTILN